MSRIALALALAVTACSGGGESASLSTTTTASAPATTTTLAPTTTSTTGATEPDPLDVGISIHVESFDDRQPEIYARHLAAVERVASEAQAAGITITFELDRRYVAKREPGRRNVLTMSWSIGTAPPEGFVTELAASVADLPIRWASVADLAG